MTQQEFCEKVKALEDQIKKSQAELEELKAVKIETEQPKRWKPDRLEDYWFIDSGGSVTRTYNSLNDIDRYRYLTDNCFQTEEETEEHKKQIVYMAQYKNYIEKHSEPIDWTNKEQCKYYSAFDYGFNRIDLDLQTTYKVQGIICASSKQIIEDAINEIGEDNFKKYVLGVK